MATHIPVLQKEAIEYLDPKPNENFIDCTIGEGGHSLAILEKTGPKGKVLGIEWDSQLYQKLLRSDFDRLILVNDSFINLKKIVEKHNFKPVQGILFDLGFSSWHLEESGRGFTFQKNEILDMRYNPEKQKLTAKDILNQWSESEIEKILKAYGEERFARKIAERIIEARKFRPIKTTFQLVEIIKKAVPGWYQHRKIHFATRTFQALRIAVNDELENLRRVLPQTLEVLGTPGGRLCLISFHSLEDRIVKIFFREQKNLLRLLTKKPRRPSEAEIKINPRSRSAKLRAAIKL